MASQLPTQQASDVPEAATGDGRQPLEAAHAALLDAREGDEALEACDIHIQRSTHGAYAWCRTHHGRLVGAMFGHEPFISKRVAAWRERRRCEEA